MEWDKALSLINSLFLGWLAFRDYQSKRHYVPHDIYDRRKGIYDTVMKFIAETCQNGDTDDDSLMKLLRETKDCEFYFNDQKVKSYIDELYKRGVDFEYTNKYLNDDNLPPGSRRSKLAEKAGGLMEYFSFQLSHAKNIFGPYLKIEKS